MAPIQNVAPKINKKASKINKMALIQNMAPKIDKINACLSTVQFSPVEPNIAEYSPI